MRFIVVVFALVMTAACDDLLEGYIAHDFSAPLSGGYYVHRNSADEIFVAPMQWGDDTPIIPAKVVALAHNEDWIIAKRQHFLGGDFHDPQDGYLELDPETFSYWLLRTQEPELWGPLSQSEFLQLRSSLGVTEDMELRDVYTYACGSSEYYDCDE